MKAEDIFNIVESRLIDKSILSFCSTPFTSVSYDNESSTLDYICRYTCEFNYGDNKIYSFIVAKDYHGNCKTTLIDEKIISKILKLYSREKALRDLNI